MTGKSAIRGAIALTALLLGTGAMLAPAGAAALLTVPGKSLGPSVPVVPAKSVPVLPAVQSKAPAPSSPTSKSPVPLVPTKGLPTAPSVVQGKPAPGVVAGKPPAPVPPGTLSSKPSVQIGAVATSRTYQIGFNGQVDTATEVTVQPTATTAGSITTILRTPSGQAVSTRTTVCPIGWACGEAPTAAVLAANPSWSQPARPAPTAPTPIAPSPTAGGIVGEAATLGITPAQLQVLISGPKPGDPTVIRIPNERIAQPSGVTCRNGVVATYQGNPAVSPGGTLNGRPYTGPAGAVGSWVSTCA